MQGKTVYFPPVYLMRIFYAGLQPETAGQGIIKEKETIYRSMVSV